MACLPTPNPPNPGDYIENGQGIAAWQAAYVKWMSENADDYRIGMIGPGIAIAPSKPILGQLPGSNPANPAINALESSGGAFGPNTSDDPGYMPGESNPSPNPVT
ncbi:MAG TPA: hypothetical protein VMF08_10405 [Candidatus Sulfotelmatobacter sp.]|nr:hypothetical protein [Candidatus Sulfotelmatobacter sp.]